MRKLTHFVLTLCLIVGIGSVPVQAADITATPTNSDVIINDTKVDFMAYNIAGNNYFKLRDLAVALRTTDKQFNVLWDNELKSINLISGEGYEKQSGDW